MSLAQIARQRAQLAALHKRTADTISAAFAMARFAARPALRRFTDTYASELERVREDSGDATARVSLLWLHTSGQLATLRPQVTSRLTRAAQTSAAATLAAQRQAFTLGQRNALDLMADDGGDHIPDAAHMVPGRSSYNGGVPIMSYFTALPPDAWKATETAVHAGIGSGLSESALLGLLVRVALLAPQQRADLIGQQEATGAYRQAVSLTFQANPDAVHGWLWICSFNNSCAACIAMHGSVHDASEGMDSHARCECMQMPYIHAAPDIQTGEQWFSEQDADTQRDVLGPAAYGALQNGDIANIGRLIDTSSGYVTTASLKSLGLDAQDYLS